MRLPNAEFAVVDIEKLRDYCLNADHPRGRHKARAFAAALGLTADNADKLRDAILEAASVKEAFVGIRDDFGRRFVLDFDMATESGQATVRTGWIVLANDNLARLTTCYVL